MPAVCAAAAAPNLKRSDLGQRCHFLREFFGLGLVQIQRTVQFRV